MRDWIVIGRPPTMRQIADAVGAEHGLTLDQLRTATRRKAISHPRQEAIVRMRAAGFSHHQIKDFFRLKDHTTCVHACHAVKARAEGRPVRRVAPMGPRANNAARNARIIVLFATNVPYGEIARRLGVTRGVVSGVVHRHLDALAQQEAAA